MLVPILEITNKLSIKIEEVNIANDTTKMICCVRISEQIALGIPKTTNSSKEPYFHVLWRASKEFPYNNIGDIQIRNCNEEYGDRAIGLFAALNDNRPLVKGHENYADIAWDPSKTVLGKDCRR